jgi:hypothetical protein
MPRGQVKKKVTVEGATNRYCARPSTPSQTTTIVKQTERRWTRGERRCTLMTGISLGASVTLSESITSSSMPRFAPTRNTPIPITRRTTYQYQSPDSISSQDMAKPPCASSGFGSCNINRAAATQRCRRDSCLPFLKGKQESLAAKWLMDLKPLPCWSIPRLIRLFNALTSHSHSPYQYRSCFPPIAHRARKWR